MSGLRRQKNKEPPFPLVDAMHDCGMLRTLRTRRDLGRAIAEIVLRYTPRDLRLMKSNFSAKVQTYPEEYRRRLEEAVAAHLDGTYQEIRLMQQQDDFAPMAGPVRREADAYWQMVAEQCAAGTGEESGLRFLKFLLAGFCMFVRETPGHPAGMPFPGGDRVEVIDGTYYCPVRSRSNDVDEALCPFCPALQTPEIGYLRPPVNASEHRKQEYIDHIHKGHHFNG